MKGSKHTQDPLYSLLERNFSIYLLMLIKEHPGRIKSFYAMYDEGYGRTKWERMKELEQAGLIRSSMHGSKSKTLRLTDEGDRIAEALSQVKEMMG